MTKAIKCLTVREPWAWAIIWGGKDVENRSWRTDHRGPLLIHAGGRLEIDGYEELVESGVPIPPPSELPRSEIVGWVTLMDCVNDSQSRWAIRGQWHWILEDPRPLARPIPVPGRLGLWRPPPDVQKLLDLPLSGSARPRPSSYIEPQCERASGAI